MIIFIACVFSGHILVKKIIRSELYCCNMKIFCKLLKIKIVQTSLCYITGALKGRHDEFA